MERTFWKREREGERGKWRADETVRMATSLREVCRRLPKSETHLHLDGSIPMRYIIERANAGEVSVGRESKDGGGQMAVTEADVREHLGALKLAAKNSARPGSKQNWGIFDWMNEMLQTREALEEVTAMLLEDLSDDGVKYAEIRFCPALHCNKGLSAGDAVRAVRDGFTRGAAKTGIKGGTLERRDSTTGSHRPPTRPGVNQRRDEKRVSIAAVQ